jgi:CPA2 family monovalent cation:H+ antiporter-2
MSAEVLQQALVFLAGALICVPLARKLGAGSVLGYLLAGVMIGPFVLGLVGREGEDILHASEFGVVMMLFLIGLELQPESFWRMRKAILGLGLTQVLITSTILFSILFLVFGFTLEVSLIGAFAFSMSSTAIALQTLKEKGLSATQAGQSSFSVLLLQDIAVIPVLAILPLLASQTSSQENQETSALYQVGISLGALMVLILAGRFLVNPFLRMIARTRMRELFTASALLIVAGVAWLMHLAGISAALGAFLAGILLANSEFRHELESDVEPFKGLLLGVFFTAVGSTLNFQLIGEEPGLILALVLTVVGIKALVLLFIGRISGFRTDQGFLFAFFLCQIGEFAFVLISAARQQATLDAHTAEILMAVTTLSMALAPVLILLNERAIDPFWGTKESKPEKEADSIEERNQVIIAGFGHFGSTIGRFLRANGVEATILDNDSDRVELLRKMGFKVYYGDATRLDLLKAAGAEEAKYFISALDGEESGFVLVELLKKHYPHLKIFMRTRHRFHAYQLMAKGLDHTYRESLYGSVFMGVDVLKEMGTRAYTATRKAQEFIRYDEMSMRRLFEEWEKRERYIISVREEIELQEKLMNEDMRFKSDMASDNAWDSEPLRSGGVKANEK